MTTASYHPQQQTIRAKVYSGAGWLEGVFHLAKLHAFAEYLAHHGWYTMTDVMVARVGVLPFFQLSREETLMVQAPTGVLLPTAPGKLHTVTMLLPGGSIDGVIETAEGVRLSDHIDKTTSFLHLKQASVKVWADSTPHSFDDLLVNKQRVVGLTESGPE